MVSYMSFLASRVRSTRGCPFMSGRVCCMNWAFEELFEFDLESRYQKLRIGPDLYATVRHDLAKAGLLDRAGVYFRNSVAWQRLLQKNAVETARLSQCVAGYDFLGINDTHWHRTGYAVGLLNEFDEFKPGCSADLVRTFNNESVLLVSEKRERNLAAGQPLRRDISLSWFSHGTLHDAALHWSLTTADGMASRWLAMPSAVVSDQ